MSCLLFLFLQKWFLGCHKVVFLFFVEVSKCLKVRQCCIHGEMAQPTIQLRRGWIFLWKKFLMQLFCFFSSAPLKCLQIVRVVDNFMQSDTFKVELLPHCTALHSGLDPSSLLQSSKYWFSKFGQKQLSPNKADRQQTKMCPHVTQNWDSVREGQVKCCVLRGGGGSRLEVSVSRSNTAFTLPTADNTTTLLQTLTLTC